jgi:hypothetical protein
MDDLIPPADRCMSADRAGNDAAWQQLSAERYLKAGRVHLKLATTLNYYHWTTFKL